MFPMMTPIDAIGLSLRAGMMFSQTQTLLVSQMMEMQGFWTGFPRMSTGGLSGPVAEAEPEVDAEDIAPVVLAPLTEILVEAPEPELLPVLEAEAPVTDAELVVAEDPAPLVIEAAPAEPAEEATPAEVVAETAAPAPLTAAPADNAAPKPKRARKPAPLAE